MIDTTWLYIMTSQCVKGVDVARRLTLFVLLHCFVFTWLQGRQWVKRILWVGNYYSVFSSLAASPIVLVPKYPLCSAIILHCYNFVILKCLSYTSYHLNDPCPPPDRYEALDERSAITRGIMRKFRQKILIGRGIITS